MTEEENAYNTNQGNTKNVITSGFSPTLVPKLSKIEPYGLVII